MKGGFAAKLRLVHVSELRLTRLARYCESRTLCLVIVRLFKTRVWGCVSQTMCCVVVFMSETGVCVRCCVSMAFCAVLCYYVCVCECVCMTCVCVMLCTLCDIFVV